MEHSTNNSSPTFADATNAPSQSSSATSQKPTKTKGFWLDALETIGIALVIFFIIYTFIAQPHLVKGESMQPNYHEGEYILTSKVYNWWGNPERGDVVVLKSPEDKNVQFIKRIIGMPGETIKISNNQVIIKNQAQPDGFALNESYLGDQTTTTGSNFLADGEEYQIPSDQYIVMGDNRNFSYDSRSWGSLEKKDIVGKAFFVYWPIPDFGIVAHAEY